MGNNSELRQRILINVLHYCVTAKLPRRLTCSSEFTQIIKMAGDTISAPIEFFSLHYTIATIKDVLGQTELGSASGFQIILLPWMLPLPRLNFKNRKRKKKRTKYTPMSRQFCHYFLNSTCWNRYKSCEHCLPVFPGIISTSGSFVESNRQFICYRKCVCMITWVC